MGYRDDPFDQREEILIKFFKPKPYPVLSHRHTAPALKIQKAFRGFLVRKSAKKLITIKRGVDDVERIMISDVEIFDRILIHIREGLSVMETLRNLLLELDSVRGVNSVIKDCRKSVANKALALQGSIDAAILTVLRTETRTLGEREDNSQRNSESAAQTLESIATDGQHSVGQIDESDGFNFNDHIDDEGAGICDDENCENNEVGDFIMVGDGDDLGTGDDEEQNDDVVDDLLEITEELCKNHRRQTKTLNFVRRVLQLIRPSN